MRIIARLKLAFCVHSVTMSFARVAAVSPLRKTDITDPNSWEFSGFSQNGEDGIIDFLAGKVLNPNRYFVEIGSANGFQNNTSWLAIARKYSGLMIEGDQKASDICRLMMSHLNIGVECRCEFLTRGTASKILDYSDYIEPDVFSLDLDGNDYYIAKVLLEAGFRPKVVVVEYNSAYGPQQSIAIKYSDNFNHYKAHSSFLYYGVSICGWRKLLQKYGYRFVTADLNGVNVFFINPACFEDSFADKLKGLEFRENFFQRRKFRMNWENQFGLIKHLEFEMV
jgi:hypothetical protein